MSNILEIDCDVTTVNKGSALACQATPLLGGAGREAKLTCLTLPLTSTVLIEGAPAIDASTGIAPVAGSSLWTTIATLTSASDRIQQVVLNELVRYNTTVLDADGPNVLVYLEGVQ